MLIDAPRGLSPTRRQLPNGAVVLAKESAATPSVTISASIAGGSAADPPGLPGTIHLLSRVLDRGTGARSPEEIAELLDSRGVSLNIAVTRHQLTLSCTCLDEDFDTMFGLVAEVLQQPALPAEEVETRRLETITAIRQDQDSPATRAIEEALRLLYPGEHPYGRRVKGTVESVERIDRQALVAAHTARFAPGALVVACVGDVEAARVVEAAERALGGWQAGQPPVSPVAAPPAPEGRRRVTIPMMNKAQADIAYGFTTIARSDPSYYAFSIMNNVLGQYALGGRLGDSIRERQGMAYYVFSTFEPNVGVGPLLVRAGVSPANVDRTIASIDDELRALARNGVTEAELAASRRFLVTSMPRMLETNGGIAGFLLAAEQFHLGLDYDVRLPALLEAVTLDEVNATARRFLDPERATITVAGPVAEQ